LDESINIKETFPDVEPEIDRMFRTGEIATSCLLPLHAVFKTFIKEPALLRQEVLLKKIVVHLNDVMKFLKTTPEDYFNKNITNKDNLISIIYKCLQIGITNHEQEKHEALLNIIGNVIIDIDIEEELQRLFLNYLDQLTIPHIKILEFCHNPEPHIKYLVKNGYSEYISTKDDIGNRFNFFENNCNLVKAFWNDLEIKGLIIYTGGLRTQRRTTKLGDDFLRFISDYKNSYD